MGNEAVNGNAKRVRVLLIDDQELIGESLRYMLKDQPDIDFHFCQDPSRAITEAIEFNPTVILQDLSMPEIDGLTLVKYFTANQKLSLVPLVVLSGNEEPITKAKAFEYGANDYLVKFPDKVEVLARLRYHSNTYHLRMERDHAYSQLKEKQEQIQNDLDEAAAYVQSLLPKPLKGNIESSWLYIPSAALSGDAFGYHWLDDETLAIYLFDVCGHGVGAALLSISVINIIRSKNLLNADMKAPAKVLQALNKAFPMERNCDRFFTGWYGVYNTKSRKLLYSSAGHPPALLITKDLRVIQLKTEGFVIGGMADPNYVSKEVDVEKDAMLYLYSDGVFELETEIGKVQTLPDFIKGLENAEKRPTLDEIYQRATALNIKDSFDDDFSIVRLAFL